MTIYTVNRFLNEKPYQTSAVCMSYRDAVRFAKRYETTGDYARSELIIDGTKYSRTLWNRNG